MPIRPSDGEIAILRIHGSRGPSTARDRRTGLSKELDTGYATEPKLMLIMEEKGLAPVSGGILTLRPAPHHDTATELESFQAAVAREFASPAFQEEVAPAPLGGVSGAVAGTLGGRGEAADREAFGWCLKAVERGDPEAMLRVGVSLFHGGPVPADKAAAKRWLDRAIPSGHPMAVAARATLFGGWPVAFRLRET